jgi:transposase
MVRRIVFTDPDEESQARRNDPPEGLLEDRQWLHIASRLPNHIGKQAVDQTVTRRFIEAVFWVAATDSTWADLPRVYGNLHVIHFRFARWARISLWDFVCTCLQDDPRVPALQRLVNDYLQVRGRRAPR